MDALRVEFHVEQSGLEVVLRRIEAVEEAIVERLFAQVIPEVLDRIQFGRIGRQFEQAQIGRGCERTALMPTRAVKDHDDPVVRMSLGDLVEEDLHALAIDLRQNQRVELPISHGDGGISVGVFLGDHGLAEWAYRLGTPAASGIGYSTEARFVLKHQANGTGTRPLLVYFFEEVGKFFFHSSWAATSAWGCRLSGANLRQP